MLRTRNHIVNNKLNNKIIYTMRFSMELVYSDKLNYL